MSSTSRPVRLLVGLGLVLAGLLGGVLLTLTTEGERSSKVVRVVKQVQPDAPQSQPAGTGTTADVPSPAAVNRLFRDVAMRVTDAVVAIRVQAGGGPDETDGPPFRPPGRGQSLGSGVLISPDGYIVTNRHVVDHSGAVQVTLADKRQFAADIVGADPATDLAVLKVDAPDDLPTLPLSSSDRVQVGDWVVAIGNPFRLTSTVTAGIVSALGRQIGIIESQFRIENFIQTDAAINPGNSGGALVNLRGELVGINTAIASGSGGYEGYGFAIPAALVERVATDLIAYGEVRRGYLGVSIQEVDADVAQDIGLDEIRGVYVGGVRQRSAADRAGLRDGDVIVTVEGEAVNAPNDLQTIVALQRPGDTVSVRVWRNGGQRTFDVRLMGKDTPAYQDWLSDLQSADGPPEAARPDAEDEPPDGADADVEALEEVRRSGGGVRGIR